MASTPTTSELLLAHWLKYMEAHTDYITDAIQRHFAANPQDRETMAPVLREELKRIREKHDTN